MERKKGVALVTAIVTLIIVLMLGGVLLYIGLNSYRTYVSSRRVESTMSAAEAGVNAGIVEITSSSISGSSVDSFNVALGRYRAKVKVTPVFTQSMYGTGTEFSSGYEPVGSGISGGGASSFYLIDSRASGPQGEKVRIEALYRKVTLSSGSP